MLAFNVVCLYIIPFILFDILLDNFTLDHYDYMTYLHLLIYTYFILFISIFYFILK